MANSVVSKPVTIVQSANGIGKSFAVAAIAIWWLDVFDEDCKVIITGSNFSTIRDTVFPYIHTHLNGARIFETGKKNQTEIRLATDRVALGRAANKHSGIAGNHARYLLQIVEEYSDLSRVVNEAVRGNATGTENRIIGCGNPLAPIGEFYKEATDPSNHVIKISALEHPNVKTGREVIRGAISRERVEELCEHWGTECAPDAAPDVMHLPWKGEDKGWYRLSETGIARIGGEFPSLSPDSIFPPILIDSAQRIEFDGGEITVIGCDVARSPVGDETTFCIGNASGVSDLAGVRGWGVGRIARYLRQLHREHPDAVIAVDSVGVGGGVVDLLRDNDIPVRDFIANANVRLERNKDRFVNLKAEAYWELRERLQTQTFALPKDPTMKRQAINIKREITNSGIKIKSKKDMEGAESPDRIEAVIIMNYALNFTESLYIPRQYTEAYEEKFGKK